MRIAIAVAAALASVFPSWSGDVAARIPHPVNSIQRAQRQDTIVRTVGAPVYPGVATLKEELSIGQPNGPEEYILSELADGQLGWDGSIFIADAGGAGGRIGPLSSLRRYDSTGKYVRTYGRAGQGPGEYRNFNGMYLLRDGRLLLNDAQSRGVHVYGPTGAHLVTWNIPRQSLSPGTTSFLVNPNGTMYLLLSDPPSANNPAPQRFAMVISSSGAVADTIYQPPAPELPPNQVTGTNSNGTPRRSTVPFSAAFRTAFSPLGYFVTARTDRYQIDVNIPGGPVTSIRRNVAPVPVTTEERNAWRTSIETSMRRTQPGWDWNGPEIPRHKPYFMVLMPDLEGRIWARVYDPQEKITPDLDMDDASINYWDVFEPSGRFLGRVRTPIGSLPNRALGNSMLGVARNADGVPRVIRYRIQWSAER